MTHPNNKKALFSLLEQVALEEKSRLQEPFLAPCVKGSQVRMSVAGLFHSFQPKPRGFEGWGVFFPENHRTAKLVEEASLPQVASYLRNLPQAPFWLVKPLRGKTWLALPANRADVRQRTGYEGPVAIRLVENVSILDRVVARWDGASWWFEEEDRRADPIQSMRMRESLEQGERSPTVSKGLTPESKEAFAMARAPLLELFLDHPSLEHLLHGNARHQLAAEHRQRNVRQTLRAALEQAGGSLHNFQDRGDFWWVEWNAPMGGRHHSAIAKNDLTVLSAGICLSGLDQHFDLQALVGVVDGMDRYD